MSQSSDELRRGLVLGLALVLAGCASAPAAAKRGSMKMPEAPQQSRLEAYGRLPLTFELNQGQIDDQVRFLSRGRGYTLYLMPMETLLVLRNSDRTFGVLRDLPAIRPQRAAMTDTAVLRMRLIGANPSPKVAGLDEVSRKSNYFIGNDRQRWHTGIPTYARVEYKDVYPGVDLVYYGSQGNLEYDFIVAPGSDPTRIKLVFEGVDTIHTDSQGDLILRTPIADLRLHRPLVYQDVAGVRVKVDGSYVLEPESTADRVPSHTVRFHLASYDPDKLLVIDPVLSYSTYLGGSGGEDPMSIAVDASGNAYIMGCTDSIDFPTVNAFQPSFAGHSGAGFPCDIYISKLDPSGSGLVYSTYLGGSDTDASERSRSLFVDSSGNAYVTGRTLSLDFPMMNPIQSTFGGSGPRERGDAFVAKLDPTGSALIFSTYLGGSDDDEGTGVGVDATGNVYVVGETCSVNFPTANPVQTALRGSCDAFVAKLSPTGAALLYSTYLGGSGDELAGGTVDSLGNVYVVGATNSQDFPTSNALQSTFGGGGSDAFVTKIAPTGSSLVYSTYLGGSGDDSADGIAVDGLNNAYVTGFTSSSDFPTVNPMQPGFAGGSCTYSCSDAFVAKLDATGGTLVYSTYLGGSGDDVGAAIAVDASGSAYVTGFTGSADFPTMEPFQAGLGGFSDSDGFVAKLNAGGSALVYSTFLGGSGGEEGRSIAVDSGGAAYVTGFTDSPDFPVTAGAFQTSLRGGDDPFVVKIVDGVQVAIDIKPGSFPNSVNLGSGGTLPVVIFSTATFDATTVDPNTVTLASAPVKLKGQGTPMASFQDANRDGLLDLVVHVSIEALQLSGTDEVAVLEGRTSQGVRIRGSDSVRIVP